MSPLREDVLEQLGLFFGDSLVLNEPLRKHCTYRIGGPAEVFVSLRSTDNLADALQFCHEEKVPVTVLGGGSNILFPDEGLEGIVIKVALDTISFANDRLTVQAGIALPRLARILVDSGLSGLEFASGIPGTLGGAVIMNAGYGENFIGQMVESVSGFALTGRMFEIDRENLDFRYRTSSLRNTRKLITQVTLKFERDEPRAIKDRMIEFREKRKAAQPLEYPSAGSIFKNPPETPAWKLVDEAGCRGLRVGDAQVSGKHANFIINLGEAKYSDVREIIDTVLERVYNKSGTMLELELLDLGASAQRKRERP